MDWINLHVSLPRSAEFMGTAPAGRATWLSVLAYCHEQENGGRIVAGMLWPDRQWMQACGVTKAEIRRAPLLLTIEENDIVVRGYPIEKEKEVQARRQGGSKGAAIRWGKRSAHTPPNGSPNGSSDSSPIRYPDTEREEEGKGKGKEGIPLALSVLEETAARIIDLASPHGEKTRAALSYEAEHALEAQVASLPLAEADWALLRWWLALPDDSKHPHLREGVRPRDANRLAIRLWDQLERARAHAEKTQKKERRRPVPVAPQQWQETFRRIFAAEPPAEFDDLPPGVREEISGALRGEVAA